MKQIGLFDLEFRLQEISKHGDPLETLNKFVDWEYFRPTLNDAFRFAEKSPLKGGRPPFDYVLMFKILVLQKLNNLSDDRIEFAIKDRLSFQRFLDIDFNQKIPDQKTIWHFREMLTQRKTIEKLFYMFNRMLERKNLIVKQGSIVDASFVEAPRQRNSRKENECIKNGETPAEWNDAKKRQKDTEARWTTKGSTKYFGYKNHIKVDMKSKMITRYKTTSANVHDSQVLEKLIDTDDANQELYADSAYRSQEMEAELKEKGIVSCIHEKGYRAHPLNETQKANNNRKSKVRARVEHVFGYMRNSLKEYFVRCVGVARADAQIGLSNLIYNIARYVFLCRA
jgi:IS5 family transposase